jgi:hypothetical protein
MALAYGDLTRFHNVIILFMIIALVVSRLGDFSGLSALADQWRNLLAKPSTKPFRLVATVQTFLAVLFLLKNIAAWIR